MSSLIALAFYACGDESFCHENVYVHMIGPVCMLCIYIVCRSYVCVLWMRVRVFVCASLRIWHKTTLSCYECVCVRVCMDACMYACARVCLQQKQIVFEECMLLLKTWERCPVPWTVFMHIRSMDISLMQVFTGWCYGIACGTSAPRTWMKIETEIPSIASTDYFYSAEHSRMYTCAKSHGNDAFKSHTHAQELCWEAHKARLDAD